MTPPCPFSPILLKNGSVVGDPRKDPTRRAPVRSRKDVDGSPFRVPFRLSQTVPFVTVGVGLKGCELFRVNDSHPSWRTGAVRIRINYPADGTSLPGKKKNEVLPLILVNVLFLVTPGAIMEKKNILARNHSSPFVLGAMRELICGFMSCCF